MINKIYTTLTLTLLLFSLTSQAQIYDILGNHSSKGAYSGKLQIYNGQVVRLIYFRDFQFNNFSVQSVLSGSDLGNTVEFDIPISNALTSYNGWAPDPSVFKSPTPIQLTKPVQPINRIEFELPNDGLYSEVWKLTPEKSTTMIWVNQRSNEDAYGDESSWLLSLAMKLGIDMAIKWYRNQPEADPWRNRPEFQNASMFHIRDVSDLDFYKENKSTLRVDNRSVNPLSLAESLQKRNAFAPSFAEKVKYFDTEIQDLNLNPMGLLELAEVNSSGQKIKSFAEGDSALWTGVYAYTQALRYQTVHEPQALINANRAIEGLINLIEITGSDTEFARTILRSPPTEDLGANWIQGTGRFSAYKWLKTGNNDMCKGLLIGLAVGFDTIPKSDLQLRSRALSAVLKLYKLKPIAESSSNLGLARGLEALWTGNSASIDQFIALSYNVINYIGEWSTATTGFYYGGIADWSGIHLTMVSTLSLYLISKKLTENFSYSEKGYLAKYAQNFAENHLFKLWKSYRKAGSDFLTIITAAISPAARKDPDFQTYMIPALRALRDVPAPRSTGVARIDFSLHGSWSLSAWPRLPWKMIKSPWAVRDGLKFSTHWQGAYSYPIYEALAWQSTYIWKDSPYYIHLGGNSSIKTFSADYLLVYWMAKSSGQIP